MSRTIAGSVDWRDLHDASRRDAVEYERRRLQHRPDDPELLRAEIRHLARTGLRAADISQAIGIGYQAVLEALRDTESDSKPPRSSS